MRKLKILFIFIIMIGFVSCASHQSSLDKSEYQHGYKSAWEFAKKDALKSLCNNQDPRYFNVRNKEAKKYVKLLQKQGRSEAYIKGFYSGYQNSRLEFFDLYCFETTGDY